MSEAEVSRFNNSSVIATLIDGHVVVGRLYETPLAGKYTIQPNPTVHGTFASGGFVEAIHANHFAKIEACSP